MLDPPKTKVGNLRNLRLRPKSAFLRFPAVHRADLERQQRVETGPTLQGPVVSAREWKISGLSGRQREISCCLEPAVQHCCANYRDAVGSSGRPSHTLLLGHARIGDFIHTAFRARC